MTGFLPAALELAAAGVPVFPCKPTKAPYLRQGFKAASADPATLHQWGTAYPDALVGVPTGEPSGLFVLDVDRHGDKDGFATLAALGVELPRTQVHATPGGGAHYFFRWQPGMTSSAGKIGAGVDTRGTGGYVIWWPAHGGSVEAMGEVADVPGWLTEALAAGKPKGAQERAGAAPVPDPAHPTDRYARAVLERATGAIVTAPDGTRNDTLNREAFGLYGIVKAGRLDKATADRALLGAAGAAGLEPLEIGRTLQSAWESAAPRLEGLPQAPVPEAATAAAAGLARALVGAGGAGAPEPPGLVPVPLDDLMRTAPPAVRFVVEPIIPRRLATLLSAHGGTGKSSLALAICAHVAAGQRWAGFDVIQGRALFVSLEDPGEIVRWRLRRIIEAFELDPAAVLPAVAVLDGSDLRDGIMHERMFEGVRYLVESPPFKELRQHAAGASLIVLDNASDAADFNENERRFVRRFIRALAKLARDANAGLLLLAHIDKTAARYGSQGESYSGSTAWHNSVRSRLALLAQDGGTVELVHEKANLSRKAEPRLFAWSADGVLLPTTAQAAQAGAQAASGLLAAEDARHVLEAIQTAHRGAAPVSASREGAHSARATLVNCGLPESLAKGSAARFYRALDLLLSDGRAVIEEITTADRKTRKRLFPAPNLRAQPLRASIPPYPPSDDGRTGCAPIAPVMRPTDERGSAHPIQPPAWAIDPKAGPDPEKVAA